MPPKPKFTREEIVQTALDIVSRKGAEALTAKELNWMAFKTPPERFRASAKIR